MKKTLYLSSALLLLYAFMRPQSTTPDPAEIVRKAEENAHGVKSAQTTMTITIVRPKWTREMSLKTWSKGEKYGMILITAPAKEKGTVFLKRDKEVWNWVPAVERTIKLPPSMMMQSWMGTDFTNDDLVRESSKPDDYTHKMLHDTTLQNRPCYKIEMKPKPNAAVVWDKLVLYIDKKDYIEMRAEMYDEKNKLVNVLNCSEIKKMGGRSIASRLELIPMDKKGHRTVMAVLTATFDEDISDSFFTTDNMKKVK